MRISRCSFPLNHLRYENYRRIEPGILPAVKALVRARCVPVWSCQGHPRDRRPSSWFTGKTWRLVRGRPFVVCSGTRFSTKKKQGAVYAAMRLLDEGRGPLRLIYLHVRKGRAGDDLMHRVRWVRGREFYAIVFADKRAVLTLAEQEKAG
jgi:hypothetical protein